MNQPLLSLCIPTYNRDYELENLLNFIEHELYLDTTLKDKIEIIISDNHSTDNTRYVAQAFIANNDYNCIYNHNETNQGLIGNLLTSLETANGKYIWWMGDDDYYKPGIISAVVKACENNYDFIFLNHSCTFGEPWSGNIYQSILDEIGKPISNIDIIDLVRFYSGALMFISANVYRRSLLLDGILKSAVKKNLAFPLYCGLYCASQEKYTFLTDVWISCKCGDNSWKESSQIVHLFNMPYYIGKMPNLGYDKARSRELFKYLYPHIYRRQLKFRIKQSIKKLLKQ